MEADRQWPPLPLAEWMGTRQTLHRYTQIVGKVRMALVPFRNHWWHVTLYVDTRGLTTGPMPLPDGRSLEIAFDFVEHRLVTTTSDGDLRSFDLRHGLACGDFYGQLFGILEALGVEVEIYPAPYDLGGPLLSEDREHDAYDAEAVVRYWTVLRRTTDVLNRFAGRFNGKQSPVQLFWHSFDLAMARYSGKRAPERPGADPVTVEAYSHEVIAFGFWPGDEKAPAASFYSYTAPAPPGLTEQALSPESAWWNVEAGTAYLSYDDVRSAGDPESTLLGFFESAYSAGATLAGWDLKDFRSNAPA
ncbi:MAG TPA: DUF5996 family protein [Actinomycetota bacterium]|nr:DUF5996 family protein [Actinomycetota bacterium]